MRKEEFDVVYSNLVTISHAELEFAFDFKRTSPEIRNPEDTTPLIRIVMNPKIAKAFLSAFAQNMKMYEERYGETT